MRSGLILKGKSHVTFSVCLSIPDLDFQGHGLSRVDEKLCEEMRKCMKMTTEHNTHKPTPLLAGPEQAQWCFGGMKAEESGRE